MSNQKIVLSILCLLNFRAPFLNAMRAPYGLKGGQMISYLNAVNASPSPAAARTSAPSNATAHLDDEIKEFSASLKNLHEHIRAIGSSRETYEKIQKIMVMVRSLKQRTKTEKLAPIFEMNLPEIKNAAYVRAQFCEEKLKVQLKLGKDKAELLDCLDFLDVAATNEDRVNAFFQRMHREFPALDMPQLSRCNASEISYDE